jgi:hypothetical protein
LGNIGLGHWRRGEQAEALDYLQQARAIYLEMGDRGAGWQAVERALAEIGPDAAIR